MKKTFNYLTTFKVGRVTSLMCTVILCLLVVNVMLWQPLIHEAKAAANANVPNFTNISLTVCPNRQYDHAYFSGTTFSGESTISIVVNENGDGIRGGWDVIQWDFQTSTVGTWAGSGAYNYRDLVYDSDGSTTPETFYGTLTSSTVGGEWWVYCYDVWGD